METIKQPSGAWEKVTEKQPATLAQRRALHRWGCVDHALVRNLSVDEADALLQMTITAFGKRDDPTGTIG